MKFLGLHCDFLVEESCDLLHVLDDPLVKSGKRLHALFEELDYCLSRERLGLLHVINVLLDALTAHHLLVGDAVPLNL